MAAVVGSSRTLSPASSEPTVAGIEKQFSRTSFCNLCHHFVHHKTRSYIKHSVEHINLTHSVQNYIPVLSFSAAACPQHDTMAELAAFNDYEKEFLSVTGGVSRNT